MIIWINGAFGVGKSHTAAELRRRSAGSVLVDPEEIGAFLRRFLPGAEAYGDFQEIPLWPSLVRDSLIHSHGTGRTIIVPMTVVDDGIHRTIMDGLQDAGCELRHFTLVAGKATVERRLKRRGDGRAWNFRQVDRCVAALAQARYGAHIDTEVHDLDSVVELIAAQAGLSLVKPRLRGLARRCNWLKISLGLIR